MDMFDECPSASSLPNILDKFKTSSDSEDDLFARRKDSESESDYDDRD
jgi:hypothetical protein